MPDMMPAPVESPSAVYLAGRREWNERYGSYISREQRARWLSYALAASLVVSGACNAWQASQSHVQLMVERVNQLGEVMGVQAVPIAPPPDYVRIKAQLMDWVRDIRTVYKDPTAERNIVTQAYDWTMASSPAVNQLDEWFRSHNPFDRASKGEEVGVSVESATVDGSGTWQIEWHESHTSTEGGNGPSVEFWKVAVNIVINAPKDEATAMKNPNGVYVRWFNFSSRTGMSGKLR